MGTRRRLKPIFQLTAIVAISTILITGLTSVNISLATGPTPIVAVITNCIRERRRKARQRDDFIFRRF